MCICTVEFTRIRLDVCATPRLYVVIDRNEPGRKPGDSDGEDSRQHDDLPRKHPYLRGCKVRIVAVMKRAAASDYDPDRDGSCLRDDDEIAGAGGVTADDRVEVQPWIAEAQRWSFVTSDPRAIDLACFRGLTKAN